MARTANKPTPHAEPAINEQQLAEDAAKLPVLAARLAEIDEQFGDGLPYDRNRYLDKCRYHMARSAEEALEVGRCLAVMREREDHGDWQNVLASIGIEQSLARRMIQAAVRFSNRALTHDLVAAAKSKTKLFELLVLDDQEIQQLADGGSAAGLTLDDIDSMTVSELRAQLRESRAEMEAKEKVLADKDRKINDLAGKKTRIKAVPPDDVLTDLLKETVEHANTAAGNIQGQLRQAFQAIREHHEEHGGDSTHLMAGHVAELQKHLAELRAEFMLPDFYGDGRPEYEKWDEQTRPSNGGQQCEVGRQ